MIRMLTIWCTLVVSCLCLCSAMRMFCLLYCTTCISSTVNAAIHCVNLWLWVTEHTSSSLLHTSCYLSCSSSKERSSSSSSSSSTPHIKFATASCYMILYVYEVHSSLQCMHAHCCWCCWMLLSTCSLYWTYSTLLNLQYTSTSQVLQHHAIDEVHSSCSAADAIWVHVQICETYWISSSSTSNTSVAHTPNNAAAAASTFATIPCYDMMLSLWSAFKFAVHAYNTHCCCFMNALSTVCRTSKTSVAASCCLMLYVWSAFKFAVHAWTLMLLSTCSIYSTSLNLQ